ncbi:VWA domain-containing protein [Halobacteriovorax sp. RZ-3]|uniref:VWA domain-containing protein n=1 Tax=unclassified Halobacteriovorax TaxID=2639665 RepID=UPI003721011A
MRQRKSIDVFNISFLDLLSGALGAVIILFIVVPKNETPVVEKPKEVCVDNSQALSQCEKLAKDQKKVIQELTAQITPPKAKPEPKPEPKPTPTPVAKSADVGFNFKGKHVAFLIDVSGSMGTDDRIGQVKAGLKMLIASMGKDYYVDIIYFPGKNRSSQYALWGVLQDLRDLKIKEEVYEFLASLRPYGATPTRAALKYVIDQYPQLTDIVLLSDGSPTKSGRTTSPDNIDDIVRDITDKNNLRKVQINAIGVGAKNFSKSSDLYKFLKNLTDANNGFFYGF